MSKASLRQSFKKLANKNATKPKKGDTPGNFVGKALTPLGKNMGATPSPGF
jgi:hypothetical protein